MSQMKRSKLAVTEAAERLRTVGCEAEDDTDEAGSGVVVDS